MPIAAVAQELVSLNDIRDAAARLRGVAARTPLLLADEVDRDTRVWLKLARDRAVFGSGDTPFEQARAPWRKGLLE